MGSQTEAQFRLRRAKACSGHRARPRQPKYRFSVFFGLCFPCPGGDGEEGHTCSWVGPPSPWQHVSRAEPRGLSCRGQSLRLGGGLDTWSWQVRRGVGGRWEAGAGQGEALTVEGVCLQCAYWQGWLTTGSYRELQGIPVPICTSHHPWPWMGPMLSPWISEFALSPAKPKETLGPVWVRLPSILTQMPEHQILVH